MSPQTGNELRRVFGRPGTVEHVNPLGMDASELVDQMRGRGPSAVVIDGVGPPYAKTVRSLSSDIPVLEEVYRAEDRPLRERHAGPPPRQSIGLGTRDDAGVVTRLEDGALDGP